MSTTFSSKLAPRDHARLAQRLADDIARLREARLQHCDTQPARDSLDAFLADELIPYLRAEEDELYAAPANSQAPGRFRLGKKRVLNRRLRQHRELIGAADALHSTTTLLQALTDAQRVASLLNAHLVEEDRELLAAPRQQTDDGSVPSLMAALATEMNEVLAHDHVRIARAISLARHVAAEDPANRVGACDRAVAAPVSARRCDVNRRLPVGPTSSSPRGTGSSASDDCRPAPGRARYAALEQAGARGGTREPPRRGPIVADRRTGVATTRRRRRTIAPAVGPVATSRTDGLVDGVLAGVIPALPDATAPGPAARRLAHRAGRPRPVPHRSVAGRSRQPQQLNGRRLPDHHT